MEWHKEIGVELLTGERELPFMLQEDIDLEKAVEDEYWNEVMMQEEENYQHKDDDKI